MRDEKQQNIVPRPPRNERAKSARVRRKNSMEEAPEVGLNKYLSKSQNSSRHDSSFNGSVKSHNSTTRLGRRRRGSSSSDSSRSNDDDGNDENGNLSLKSSFSSSKKSFENKSNSEHDFKNGTVKEGEKSRREEKEKLKDEEEETIFGKITSVFKRKDSSSSSTSS